MYHVFGFNAVCADILYGRCTYLTWNPGKVFESGKSLGDAPIHQLCPFLACPCYYECCFGIFVVTLDALDSAVQDKPVEVVHKQKIASSSYVKHFVFEKFGCTRDFCQFLDGAVFGKQACFCGDAESGEMRYVVVLFEHI